MLKNKAERKAFLENDDNWLQIYDLRDIGIKFSRIDFSDNTSLLKIETLQHDNYKNGKWEWKYQIETYREIEEGKVNSRWYENIDYCVDYIMKRELKRDPLLEEIKAKNKDIAFIVYKENKEDFVMVKADEMDYDKLAQDYEDDKIYDCFSFDTDFSKRIREELDKRNTKFIHLSSPSPICPDCVDKLREVDEVEPELEME